MFCEGIRGDLSDISPFDIQRTMLIIPANFDSGLFIAKHQVLKMKIFVFISFFVSFMSSAHAACIFQMNRFHPQHSDVSWHWVFQMTGGRCEYLERVVQVNRRLLSIDVVKKPSHLKIDVQPIGTDIRVIVTSAPGFKGEDFYQKKHCFRNRNGSEWCGHSSHYVTVK